MGCSFKKVNDYKWNITKNIGKSFIVTQNGFTDHGEKVLFFYLPLKRGCYLIVLKSSTTLYCENMILHWCLLPVHEFFIVV